jgi:predicted Rossmann-fold nucleotide-binding protein
MRVCIFAASSSRINRAYADAASELGILLSRAGTEVVFGGGRIGLMGILADAILENNGIITGVIPSCQK